MDCYCPSNPQENNKTSSEQTIHHQSETLLSHVNVLAFVGESFMTQASSLVAEGWCRRGLLSTWLRVTSRIKTLIKQPRMYSLQLKVKYCCPRASWQKVLRRCWTLHTASLQKVGKLHAASRSSSDEGALPSATFLMRDERLLRLQPKVTHKDSLVHQHFHRFYDCSCPCLSRAKEFGFKT